MGRRRSRKLAARAEESKVRSAPCQEDRGAEAEAAGCQDERGADQRDRGEGQEIRSKVLGQGAAALVQQCKAV